MAKPSNKWTRDEHILVFNLYCRIPFGRQHSRAPEIIELAKLLGRSRGSVALKLNNFSRLDPELKARGIRGAAHGAKGEIEVWRDFEDDPEALAFESERLLAQFTGRKLGLESVNGAEFPGDFSKTPVKPRLLLVCLLAVARSEAAIPREIWGFASRKGKSGKLTLLGGTAAGITLGRGGRTPLRLGRILSDNGTEVSSGTRRRFCLSATEGLAIQVLRHSWDSRSHHRKRSGCRE